MNFVDLELTKIEFETQSGKLSVERAEDLYTMNFPSRMPLETAANPLLEDALGCKVLGTYLSRDLLVLTEAKKQLKIFGWMWISLLL